MGNAATDAKRRQRLRRKLEAKGTSPDRIERALRSVYRKQAFERDVAAWRLRHPRLSDQTIRLVVAELRRNRTGAA